MPLRLGFLGVAHPHALSYATVLQGLSGGDAVAAWDRDEARLAAFAAQTGLETAASPLALLDAVDAVVVASETAFHLELIELAATHRKPILCEKPLVAHPKEVAKLQELLGRHPVRFMTAFPCRYAPAYQRLCEQLRDGAVGEVKAIAATNRGVFPGGWFADPALAGGGAAMDHGVHVIDLFYGMLGEEPSRVSVSLGSELHRLPVEDSAIFSLEYPSGVFATLDASWSRPEGYRTWGDVTMNVVGSAGVIELDLFAQDVEFYGLERHRAAPYGSSLDTLMLKDFIRCVTFDLAPPVGLEEGLRACRAVFEAYSAKIRA